MAGPSHISCPLYVRLHYLLACAHEQTGVGGDGIDGGDGVDGGDDVDGVDGGDGCGHLCLSVGA